MPLLAQYNGYASATFETAAQCAARADVLDAALAAQRGVGPVFRLMGRTVKMPCANERRVPGEKQRLFYLDFIRAVALVCILVIHFNAAVTGYFTLPSKLFGSVLPFNIYLGTLAPRCSLWFPAQRCSIPAPAREESRSI